MPRFAPSNRSTRVSSVFPRRPALQPVLHAFIVGLCLALLAGCAGGNAATEPLTDAEMRKLSAPLQQVMQGETPSGGTLTTTTTSDGATAYAVLVRTTAPEDLDAAGLPTGSTAGSVVTARWTAEQIRMAARMASVQRIEAAGTAEPTS